jgi:hypothetical protein
MDFHRLWGGDKPILSPISNKTTLEKHWHHAFDYPDIFQTYFITVLRLFGIFKGSVRRVLLNKLKKNVTSFDCLFKSDKSRYIQIQDAGVSLKIDLMLMHINLQKILYNKGFIQEETWKRYKL